MHFYKNIKSFEKLERKIGQLILLKENYYGSPDSFFYCHLIHRFINIKNRPYVEVLVNIFGY